MPRAPKVRAKTEADALQLFRESGALHEGHFVLRSGLHSRQYFQCALALQQMPVVEQFGAALAERVRHLEPRTVLAPAMGGLVIGQEVARQLRSRFIFVEKEEGRGRTAVAGGLLSAAFALLLFYLGLRKRS